MRGGIWVLARCTTYQRSTALELPGRQEEAGRGIQGCQGLSCSLTTGFHNL